jgi:hypothetical protein
VRPRESHRIAVESPFDPSVRRARAEGSEWRYSSVEHEPAAGTLGEGQIVNDGRGVTNVPRFVERRSRARAWSSRM